MNETPTVYQAPKPNKNKDPKRYRSTTNKQRNTNDRAPDEREREKKHTTKAQANVFKRQTKIMISGPQSLPFYRSLSAGLLAV